MLNSPLQVVPRLPLLPTSGPLQQSVFPSNNFDAIRGNDYIFLITKLLPRRQSILRHHGFFWRTFQHHARVLTLYVFDLNNRRWKSPLRFRLVPSSCSLIWRTHLGGNASRFFLFRLRLGWRFNHLFIRSPSRVLSLLVGLILSRSGIIFYLTHNLLFARESSAGSLPVLVSRIIRFLRRRFPLRESVAFSGTLESRVLCRGLTRKALIR